MKRSRIVDSSDEDEQPVTEDQNGAAENGNHDEGPSYPVVLSLPKRGKRSKNEDEEEFMLSESEESSLNSSEEADEYEDTYHSKTLGGFIVNSDDEGDRPRTRRARARNGYNPPPLRSSARLRGASKYGSERYDNSSEDEREQSIKAELRAELRDLRSPSPVRRELRSRPPVNYRILPPPEIETRSRPKEGGAPQRKKEMRRLYPIAGPFGGNDVVSIFEEKREDVEKTLQDLDSSENNVLSASGVTADTDPLGIETNIDFSSVGGLDTYVEKLKEMVSLPLMYPELYKRFGITPPRGVLFHGPPGTGKTLMARALAASCSHEGKKITFFMRKGADCLSKWVGEAERQLRMLFDEAKEKQPSIIFFDEIDGLAPVRSSKQEQIHASIVSTLLALMDGMDNRGQVVVIGATNRPDSVDPALRRPGRFDREFYFPLPNLEARKAIINIHTKKWDPPLSPQFVEKVAEMTKGYGGADIRALCTEAALNAIQRSYPQIYTSSQKLLVDPQSIHVIPSDVIRSLDKIVPSSLRGSTSTTNAPLPPRVQPLLRQCFDNVKRKLDILMPRQSQLTALEAAMYEQDNVDFDFQQRLDDFRNSRINRPRLLIHGNAGTGQEYIGSAILNYMEGVSSHILDLSSLFSESTTTPEASIVQKVIEAKKRSPSVILVPDLEVWFNTISPQVQSIFFSLLRSFAPTDKVLVIGIANEPQDNLDPTLSMFFGNSNCRLQISTSQSSLAEFFEPLFTYITAPPSEIMDLQDRPKRQLPELPPAPHIEQETAPKKENKEDQAKKDNRTRSQLKVKLGSLMDLFQKRYRRFKKPIVEDDMLVYLFELPGQPDVEHEYERTADDMILQVSTGKKYHNMDLDIIEDRLWNGYYCEPKQFLQDLELIHEDSLTTGDRDRIHKSSEMVANAQVAIDDIDAAFVEACRDLRRREAVKKLQKFKQLELHPQDNLADAGEHANGYEGANAAGDFGGDVVTEGAYEGQQEQLVAQRLQDPESNIGAFNGEEDVPMQEWHDPSAAEPVDTPQPVEGPQIAHDEEPSVEEPQKENSPSPNKPTEKEESQGPEIQELDDVNGADKTIVAATPNVVDFDSNTLDAFKKNLYQLCEGRNLDQLESIFSVLADTAWKHRSEWSRNEMLEDLIKQLEFV